MCGFPCKSVPENILFTSIEPGRVAQSVAPLTHEQKVPGSTPGQATYFRFSFG